MLKQIKKDDNIRLADGRRAILSAVCLRDNLYEVILLTNDENLDEIDSARCNSEDEALSHFGRLYKYYHVPELKGRYKKLANDLKAALDYGLDHAGTDDGGTCNFDSPTLYLRGWNRSMVKAAAKTAGIGCFSWDSFSKCCYVFSIPGVGQGYTRTNAAEAMKDYLEGLGYDAGMYYQAD